MSESHNNFDEIIGIKTLIYKIDFKEYENIIYSTWLKGLYHGNDWFREIPQNTYYKSYHKIIENILERSNVFIRVAYLRDDPNTIVSYAILEELNGKMVLHWMFTKEAWRKLGIIKALLPKDIKFITSLTKIGRSIKPLQWEFNPFLL